MINTNRPIQVGEYRPVFCVHFDLFLDVAGFVVENVFSHTHMLPNIECIFSAKSFSLRNLSLLTNFQKLAV